MNIKIVNKQAYICQKVIYNKTLSHYQYSLDFINILFKTQSAGAVEYTVCISAEKYNLPPTIILNMIKHSDGKTLVVELC